MNTQFKKGVLEICILSEINKSDKYGYQIVQCINKHIEVNEGTVYPILRRLAKEGYFEIYLMESNDGPARKYYKITTIGKSELAKMIKEWSQFTSSVNKIIGGKDNDE